MKIAISSIKTPKVNAVKNVINNCKYFKPILDEIEYLPKSVNSGVSDMPMTIEETMAWAKGRVDNLRKEIDDAAYYFWIEWWVMQVWNMWFLWWVVYTENNDSSQGHYWLTPFMEIPVAIMDRLLKWEDLWPLMSELSWVENLRNKQWVLWVWSDWMLDREHSFEEACKAAIAPFFNRYYHI